MNTAVNASGFQSSRNLADDIWSPAKLLSLRSDYNGVNLRFVRAENTGRDVAETQTTRELAQSESVMTEASITFQGGHKPCERRSVIGEEGGLGVGVTRGRKFPCQGGERCIRTSRAASYREDRKCFT